jgi:hypothetical protein
MVSPRVADAMLFGSTYVFPLLGFPLLAWAWWHVGEGDWRVPALVMGAPLVFGYLMPGIATNVVGRWRFTGGWRIGGFYAHHGIIYSAKMAFVLLLAMHEPTAVDAWYDIVAVILLVGGATAFGGWWHDLYAVRTGRIELVSHEPDGRTAEQVVTSFAPTAFFTLGATYAAVVIASLFLLREEAAGFGSLFAGALAVLCIVPTSVFLALDPSARHSIRKAMSRRSIHER